MGRTKGNASQGDARQRPKTSISKRDHKRVFNIISGDVLHKVSRGYNEQQEFLDISFDTSILVIYVHHIALRLWEGEVRNKNFIQ